MKQNSNNGNRYDETSKRFRRRNESPSSNSCSPASPSQLYERSSYRKAKHPDKIYSIKTCKKINKRVQILHSQKHKNAFLLLCFFPLIILADFLIKQFENVVVFIALIFILYDASWGYLMGIEKAENNRVD